MSVTGSRKSSVSQAYGPVVAAQPVKDVRSQVYETLEAVGVPDNICHFFSEVLQTEYDMNVTVDRLLNRLRNYDGRPLDPEAAFKVTQELTRNFHTWKLSIDSLAAQGRELPILTVDSATMQNSMIALCGYQSQQMIMAPGDELTIVDTTQPGKLLVRSTSSGREGFIPALCCLLPSPDCNPKATIKRLKVQLLASWTESVKAIQEQLSHCLSSTVASLTKHWRTQCAHSCGRSKDRVSRRLKRVADTLSKTRGVLEYSRLHTALFSLEKELLSLEQKPEVLKMIDTVANLDRAILCYQMLHKQWQQHRAELERERQPIRVMEQWPAKPTKNMKYYEYKVTLENVNVREEVTVVKPDQDDKKSRVEQWITETTEAMTTNSVSSPVPSRKFKSNGMVNNNEITMTSDTSRMVTTQPNGDSLQGQNVIGSTNGMDNQQVLASCSQQVHTLSLSSDDRISGIAGSGMHQGNQRVPANGQANEANIKIQNDPTIRLQGIPTDVHGHHSNSVETKPQNGLPPGAIDGTQIESDVVNQAFSKIPQKKTSDEEPWVTEEWTEENKTKITENILSQEEPMVSADVVDQAYSKIPQKKSSDDEPWVTEEWTEEHHKKNPQQKASDDEPWRTEEWTEEHKNKISENKTSEAEPLVTEEWTEEHHKNNPQKKASSDEPWRTEEWTEEHKTKVIEKTVSHGEPMVTADVVDQAYSKIPQKASDDEPWRTEEWTEEHHKKNPHQKASDDEPWRTEEWTEEHHKKNLQQKASDDEPWRTEEWTEEHHKKNLQQKASDDEPWRTEEWTEEHYRSVAQGQSGQNEQGVSGDNNNVISSASGDSQMKDNAGRGGSNDSLSKFQNVASGEQVSQQQQQQFAFAEASAGEMDEELGTLEKMEQERIAQRSQTDRRWSVAGGCTETVKTDQVISARGQEIRRFSINAVIDPRTGKEITVQEAEAQGIICQSEGIYANPENKTKMHIQEAMNENLIKVTYQTLEKSKEDVKAIGMVTIKYSVDPMIKDVIDEATGEKMTCEEAQRRGLLDANCEIYTMTRTGERMALDDAIEKGYVTVTPGEYNVDTYAITAVVDQKLKKKVPFVEAVERNIFDRKTGHYIDNVTGEKVYVADAIRRGFLQAKLVDNTQGLDIEAENRMIVDRMDMMRANVLDKIGQLADSMECL